MGIATLFAALALGAGAQTLGSFSAADAAAFQARLPSLGAIGVPAALASRLLTLDPRSPADRWLLAPVALAWRAAPPGAGHAELLAEARRLIDSDTRATAAAVRRPEASLPELQRAKLSVAFLHQAAVSYEATAAADELVEARRAIAARVGEALTDDGHSVARALGAAAGAAPVDAGEARRTPGLLRRAGRAITHYFREDPPPAPVDSPALRAFRRFEATDFWATTAPPAREEVLRLRRLPSKEARASYLRAEGEKIMAKLRDRRGVSTLGFHYNMHGGRPVEYVDKGILATMGDRITNRSQNPWTFDARKKVFFFHSPGETLYDILDAKKMDAWPLPLRMGDSIMIFDLEDPALVEGLSSGKIGRHTIATWNMSLTFEGMPGIPYSAFVMPPLQVFGEAAKRLGLGRLSRDEETLAAMRLLETAALSADLK